MSFPQVTASQWRAQVDEELAGASFDKTLVTRTAEGLLVQPLYAEGPAGPALSVDAAAGPFKVCARLAEDADAAAVAAEIAGGADAIWVPTSVALEALGAIDAARTLVVVDAGASARATLEAVAPRVKGAAFVLGCDPFADVALGRLEPSGLGAAREGVVAATRLAGEVAPGARTVAVSTLPYHDAGADAADELALALSAGVAHLESLVASGLGIVDAAHRMSFRVASGRDTFGELCKLRALRILWRKVLAASGAASAAPTFVHAVCSARTLAQRDPWVNMLRVTTEVFAAALGGADLVTPAAFDEALGPASALGRRVARNTGLVLREESSLGRVKDPAAGAYFFDSLTDALARESWSRFRAIQKDGGIEKLLVTGQLRAKLEAGWRDRVEALAKRKTPVLGVSDFANLDEKLPRAAHGAAAHPGGVALVPHREAEPFEALRLRADALAARPEAVLVALGPLAESRPRVSFAANFFGAGGIRVRETSADERATVACLCGSDERYAAEAAARARALKAAGCARVLVAGRPGALEAPLREAGVDGFVYVGCDAVAILSELVEAFR
jgi:methylmalonyl-CoA mutase